MEEIGAVIHNDIPTVVTTIDTLQVYNYSTSTAITIPAAQTVGSQLITTGWPILINYTGAAPDPKTVYVNTVEKGWILLYTLSDTWYDNTGTTTTVGS